MNDCRCPRGLTSLCRVVRGAVFEASSVVGVSADADCPMCAASCIGGGASGGPCQNQPAPGSAAPRTSHSDGVSGVGRTRALSA
eukprot:2080448-Prymnesium_polylepis.1